MNRYRLLTRACALSAIIFSTTVFAQSAVKPLTITAADRAAATQATKHFISATPMNSRGSAASPIRTDSGESGHGSGNSGGRRYPGDLEFNNQGAATIQSATQHSLYLLPTGSVCLTFPYPPNCWGKVEQFLSDLSLSNFIHVTDQYVGTTARNRYPVGPIVYGYFYTLPANPLTDADMAALAHAVAVAAGFTGGYSHMVNIFLPPEQAECFDSTFTVCSTNVFCAYHSSVVFSDIGEIIYTVEPYELTPGCSVRPNAPNGGFDATYNSLSHEVFESITDPDGTAWWNSLDNGIFGEEIGDECSFITFSFPPDVYFDPSDEYLNGRHYAVQPEYSNNGHVCSTGTSD
jgi:hypothetical protein